MLVGGGGFKSTSDTFRISHGQSVFNVAAGALLCQLQAWRPKRGLSKKTLVLGPWTLVASTRTWKKGR